MVNNFLIFDKLHDLDESSKMSLATLAYNQEKYLTAIRYFDQIHSDLGNDAKMKKAFAHIAIEDFEKASDVLKSLSKLEFAQND